MRVHRQFLPWTTVFVAACSSDGVSAGDYELASNAVSYEVIPGVPSPPLTFTLHNRSGDFIGVLVCSHEGTPTAPIQYQQQLENGSWANIPFNNIVCDLPGNQVRVEPGAAWTLPPEGFETRHDGEAVGHDRKVYGGVIGREHDAITAGGRRQRLR